MPQHSNMAYGHVAQPRSSNGIPSPDQILYLKKWLLVVHEISKEDYDDRKKLFFRNTHDNITPLPMDKRISRGELETHVQGKLSGFENVVFSVQLDTTPDPNNPSVNLPYSNDDIAFTNGPCEFKDMMIFSIIFFNALLDYFNDMAFLDVTKTVSPFGNNMGKSIAFRAVAADGQTALYHADLSGVYP